ncbi:RsmB/NOP family class I SAM-dependent RNA methyltransferase [Candidatus Woesearchaeota archaeon]|nr:MAG: RsmB/NOP family class I SAM-dependent RNA methyltransferase [Candidatus Woesearchaeota archaeon]
MTLRPFPDAEKFELKEKFVERYSKITDWETFKKYTLSFLRKSIRANTLKIKADDLRKRLEKNWILTPVPWCPEGFFIEHKGGRRDVGNTIEHALGYYYVQEAASMIPPLALEPKPGELVLDMAASPGSKTSQIAQLMKNEGLVVANDVKGQRLAALGINLQRVGAHNTIITLMQGQQFKRTSLKFDKVLLDAPCTGTGTIRKSPKTIQMWNPGMVNRISRLQKKLIESAWHVLKPGGVLVYSTCSLEPQENEEVVSHILETEKDAKTEPIHLNLKNGGAILEFEGKKYHKGVENCLRLWPQDNDTEGFFIAKIRKIKNSEE